MGRPVRGSLFAVSFLACFAGMLLVFFRGYLTYLEQSTGNLMLDGTMEGTSAFPTPWMLGLLVLALTLFFGSFVGLRPETFKTSTGT